MDQQSQVPDTEELAQSAALEDPPAGHDQPAEPATKPAPRLRVGSSTELLESQQGRVADAPLCLTCGTKMRPAGSCYVCEGCGSTSGCS
jgi:ribonucleoside-diphosphate reductase alpha chain